MADIKTLANPLMRDLALPADRPIQSPENLKLPKDTVIVSADSHWDPTADIFFERLPEKFRRSTMERARKCARWSSTPRTREPAWKMRS